MKNQRFQVMLAALVATGELFAGLSSDSHMKCVVQDRTSPPYIDRQLTIKSGEEQSLDLNDGIHVIKVLYFFYPNGESTVRTNVENTDTSENVLYAVGKRELTGHLLNRKLRFTCNERWGN